MKKKIMIDMDEVITTGGFLYLINKYLDKNYTMEDFKDFYMQDMLPDKNAFFEWFKTQNVYDHCEMLPNAKEVLEELNKYYDVYIGTSYIYPDIAETSGFILEQKCNYLHKELPFITPYQYIFLDDKSVLNVDIKIDDKVDNLSNCERKLLFTAYHNKNISKEELERMGIERVTSWLDIKNKLIDNK